MREGLTVRSLVTPIHEISPVSVLDLNSSIRVIATSRRSLLFLVVRHRLGIETADHDALASVAVDGAGGAVAAAPQDVVAGVDETFFV